MATPYTHDLTLREWFAFHPADTDRKRKAHENVRTCFYALAREMNELLPEGPEKAIALRAIQDAANKANACLALGGGPLGNYAMSPGYAPGVHLVDILDDFITGTNPVI